MRQRRSAVIGAGLLTLGLFGATLPANAAADPLSFSVDKIHLWPAHERQQRGHGKISDSTK